jgi:N4-gp56 family major capsid protein
MANVNTTTFANQYQKFFSKQLLTYAIQALALAQFGQKAPLPKKGGTNSIRWFKYGVPSTSAIQTLTEGTPISSANYRTLSQTVVDATLAQYGQVIQLTDVLLATEFFDSLKQATKTNGEDAALHMDTVIRNVLIAAATNKRYSQGLATFAALSAASTSAGCFVATDALDAVTNLKINRAPMHNGGYVAIAPPQITRDLQRDTDWLEAAKYSNVQSLYKGELGSFHGLRFVEATNPFRETSGGTEGTFSSSGGVYSTVVLGAEAFGVPDLAGNSPFSPQVIINDKADKSDPLNQTVTVGFKTYWAAKELNTDNFVVIRSKTRYA